MKCIAYVLDAKVHVVFPCVSRDDPDEFTEDDALARAIKKDVPAGATDVLVIDESAIPADRAFRNSWRIQAGAVVSDMSAPTDHRIAARASLKTEVS